MKVTEDKQPNKSEIYSQHSTVNRTIEDSYYQGIVEGSTHLNNTFLKAYHGEAIRKHEELLRKEANKGANQINKGLEKTFNRLIKKPGSDTEEEMDKNSDDEGSQSSAGMSEEGESPAETPESKGTQLVSELMKNTDNYFKQKQQNVMKKFIDYVEIEKMPENVL